MSESYPWAWYIDAGQLRAEKQRIFRPAAAGSPDAHLGDATASGVTGKLPRQAKARRLSGRGVPLFS